MSRFFITIALLVLAIGANYGFSRPEPELSRRPLSEFPMVLGEWNAAAEQEIDKRSMKVLLVDEYIMRTYANKRGETIGLYIGYFKTQREGKQVHSPRQCLPGAGLNRIKHREYLLTLKDHNPPEGPINLDLMGKGAQRQLFLWWYQGRGRIYANEYLNKLYLIWDAITKRRTDGALMRISMAVTSDIDQTLETEIRFINLFAPMLPQYIPN